MLNQANTTVNRFDDTVKTICHTIRQVRDFEAESGKFDLGQRRKMIDLTSNLQQKGITTVTEAVGALDRYVTWATEVQTDQDAQQEKLSREECQPFKISAAVAERLAATSLKLGLPLLDDES